jgi:hypothetical protein
MSGRSTRVIAQPQKRAGDAACEWSKDGFDITHHVRYSYASAAARGEAGGSRSDGYTPTGIASAHAQTAAWRRRCQ